MTVFFYTRCSALSGHVVSWFASSALYRALVDDRIHVLAMQLLINRTAEAQFNVWSKVLDVIHCLCCSNLVSIDTDAECPMVGHICSAQTRFEEATEYQFLCVWGELPHSDLIGWREYEALSKDTFISTLTILVDYLPRLQNHQTETRTTCPKLWRLNGCRKTSHVLVEDKLRNGYWVAERIEAHMHARCVLMDSAVLSCQRCNRSCFHFHEAASPQNLASSAGIPTKKFLRLSLQNVQSWGPMVIRAACGTGFGHSPHSRDARWGIS